MTRATPWRCPAQENLACAPRAVPPGRLPRRASQIARPFRYPCRGGQSAAKAASTQPGPTRSRPEPGRLEVHHRKRPHRAMLNPLRAKPKQPRAPPHQTRDLSSHAQLLTETETRAILHYFGCSSYPESRSRAPLLRPDLLVVTVTGLAAATAAAPCPRRPQPRLSAGAPRAERREPAVHSACGQPGFTHSRTLLPRYRML